MPTVSIVSAAPKFQTLGVSWTPSMLQSHVQVAPLESRRSSKRYHRFARGAEVTEEASAGSGPGGHAYVHPKTEP